MSTHARASDSLARACASVAPTVLEAGKVYVSAKTFTIYHGSDVENDSSFFTVAMFSRCSFIMLNKPVNRYNEAS